EEITLGILCASLVGSIVLQQSVAPVIKTRLDQWFSDARAFSAAVLARSPSSNSQTERLRLACGAIGFDALATPLRYDMTGAERSADAMTTLRRHMLMFLPIVASIADRIEMLERMQALPEALRQRLEDMALWGHRRIALEAPGGGGKTTIFGVRCGLPCDPPVGGHSCNGGMISPFHRAVAASRVAAQPCLAANSSCPRRVAK